MGSHVSDWTVFFVKKCVRISPFATFKCSIAFKLNLRKRNSKFLRSPPCSGIFIKHVWNLLFCFSFPDPLHHNWQCRIYENYSVNWGGVCAWRKLSMAWNRVLLGICKFHCYDYDSTEGKTMKVEVNVFSSGTNDETSFVFIIGQLAVVVNILLQSILGEGNLFVNGMHL